MFCFLGNINSMWQYVVNFPGIVLLGSVVIWTNGGNYPLFCVHFTTYMYVSGKSFWLNSTIFKFLEYGGWNHVSLGQLDGKTKTIPSQQVVNIFFHQFSL